MATHGRNSQHRYLLNIPEDDWDMLQRYAKANNETAAATLKRYIRLGLHLDDLLTDPEATITIEVRKGGEKEKFRPVW